MGAEVIKSLSSDDNQTLLRIAGSLVERMLAGQSMLCRGLMIIGLEPMLGIYSTGTVYVT